MKWTEKEKQQLIEFYPLYSLAELEVVFKRNAAAISRMAISLGARKYEHNRQEDCNFDVWLRLTTVHYRVRAKHRTAAKYKAVQKLEQSLRSRNSLKDLVRLAQSTCKKTDTNGKH